MKAAKLVEVGKIVVEQVEKPKDLYGPRSVNKSKGSRTLWDGSSCI